MEYLSFAPVNPSKHNTVAHWLDILLFENHSIYSRITKMPAWDEYKTIAQERGSLAHELYVVFSEPAAPPEQMKEPPLVPALVSAFCWRYT